MQLIAIKKIKRHESDNNVLFKINYKFFIHYTVSTSDEIKEMFFLEGNEKSIVL